MGVLSDPAHLQAFHYATTSFSASVLNNVFITYYVEMVMSVSKLSSGWFMLGQIVYCIWNSFNDPIFGWLGDTRFASITQRRVPRIRIGGPLWCLAFVVTWFPWGTADKSPTLAGLHFLFTMIVYDGTLSFTLVAHQALLTDMTSDDAQRERCNMWSAACHLAGSFAVFAAHQLWDPKDLRAFQMLTLGLAAMALLGFVVTTTSPHITEEYGVSGKIASGATEDQNREPPTPPTPSLLKFIRSILKHYNFWIFVAVGLFQQFSCTFNTNFFAIFLNALTGHWMPRYFKSVMLLSTFVFPHIGTIVITPLLSKYGKWVVVKALFALRLVSAIVALYICADLLHVPVTTFFGASPAGDTEVTQRLNHIQTTMSITLLVTGFLVVNRVLTECVCRMIPLIVSDLVDEDFVRNNRKMTMSSMYFGCHALMTKPGQSAAPMFGWWVLSLYGYQAISSEVESEGAHGGGEPEPSGGSNGAIWFTMLQLILLTPIVMCAIMLVIWQFYSLHGRYLKRIKTTLERNAADWVV
eukprot:TRINITY_DN103337_c0_g1_i1.p1 TRINITY_DN103337_c0_g1~~TRINITY_DN103337_c0_g1_i1.p1  ORF type:complete len:524 (+),score=39.69 TRINITY_DN103337_c0_g1_i1:19-1590(+)